MVEMVSLEMHLYKGKRTMLVELRKKGNSLPHMCCSVLCSYEVLLARRALAATADPTAANGIAIGKQATLPVRWAFGI